MLSSERPEPPSRAPQQIAPKPNHPPTGALPVITPVPPKPSEPPHTGAVDIVQVDEVQAPVEVVVEVQQPPAAEAVPPVDAGGVPEASKSATSKPALSKPAASAEPGKPETEPSKPEAQPDTAPAPAPQKPQNAEEPSAEPAPEPTTTTVAARLHDEVSALPGVAAVGEPVSRALGRLRSVMGRPDSAGVQVTEGSDEVAVDLSIVARLSHPVRQTAAAVQATAQALLSSEGWRVAEVNVDVIDTAPVEPGADLPTTDATLSSVPVTSSSAPVAPVADPAVHEETAEAEVPSDQSDDGGQAGQAASGLFLSKTPLPDDITAADEDLLADLGSAEAAVLDGAGSVPGHVRVSPRALSSAAAQLAAATFNVPAGRVGVSLQDEAGGLALRLNLPLPVLPLSLVPGPVPAGDSVRDRALNLRAPLRRAFEAATGTSLSRVDVRVTGIIALKGGGEA